MLKRITAIVLIIFLSVGFLPGRLVWADTTTDTTSGTQTVDPTLSSSPSDLPSPSPASEPSPTPAADTLSVDPSPTPDPSPSPCTSQCRPDTTQQNEAAVVNSVAATSDTGNNTTGDTNGTLSDTQSNESTQSATVDASGLVNTSSNNSNDPSAAIKTGDAATSVEVVNQTNTNLSNSSYSYDVKNIYLDANGNVDLTSLGDLGQLPSALVFVRDQNNNATVVNLIYASANTGQNSVLGTGDVQSGNAYVSVNLLNFINSNFAGSTLQFVVFNIFGNLNGNIVLPDNFGAAAGPSSAKASEGEQSQVSQENNANIQNSVEATSNTGANSTGGGSITTGNATTAVNVLNFANFNILGGNFAGLIINNLGEWNGQFLGWGANGPSGPVFGLTSFDFGYFGGGSTGFDCGCIGKNQSNLATVENRVFATSNTGGNTTGGGSITTGRAFSAVNIFNFVNANIINAKGFFGIINIFGTLNGDIGGASNFPEPTTEPEADSANSELPDVHGPGGALGTALSTNVGSHVNGGDTVTFFATAKNNGTGPVYDGRVIFNLYDPNGNLAAVQTFDLGKLDAGRVARISFGLVLADSAPGGTYYAVMEAQGKVGPGDNTVTSDAQTSFMVGFPLGTFMAGGSIVPDVMAASTVGDGGAGQTGEGISGVASSYNWMEIVFMLLGYMGMAYMAQRILVRPWRVAVYYLGKYRPVRWPYVRGWDLASKLASRFAAGAMALRHFFF